MLRWLCIHILVPDLFQELKTLHVRLKLFTTSGEEIPYNVRFSSSQALVFLETNRLVDNGEPRLLPHWRYTNIKLVASL